ncbi:hypothetical protein B1F70_08240 [Pseudomonas syringae]|nr:hypothetical protein B1F68_23505 [Pseudomonas syringae]RXU17498.1 hypothetical protein B1F70_08240 [Pseudomonas syringae]
MGTSVYESPRLQLLIVAPMRQAYRHTQVRFWPKGVGANLFAKAILWAINHLCMYSPLREQVRSYALRAEARIFVRFKTCVKRRALSACSLQLAAATLLASAKE